MKKRSCVYPIILMAYFGLFVVASAQPTPRPGGDSIKVAPKDTVIVQQSPVAPSTGSRPSLWRYFGRYDVGMGLHFHTLAIREDVPASNVNERADFIGLSATIGVNLPIVHLSDQMTLCLSPIAEASKIMNSEYENAATLEFTGYAALKYGTDATWAGVNSGIGITAAFGYRHTILFVPARPYSFGLPNVMAEVSLGKRRSTLGLVKLRYSMSLGSYDYEIDYNDGGPTEHAFFSNYAFHLLLTPNF